MKIPDINKQEFMPVEAGVSKLSKVEFARNPCPALLKEPRNFWDEIFIANEAYMLDEITHPRVRRILAYDAASHRVFLEYVEGTTLNELVQAGVTVKDHSRTHKILQSVAETMADLHTGIFCERPIVHNDLKSMNVLVPTARPAEAVLIDFSHSYFAGNLPPFIADKQQNPVVQLGICRPRSGLATSRTVLRATSSPLASWPIMATPADILLTARPP
jgi:serine/threonine protein kinase